MAKTYPTGVAWPWSSWYVHTVWANRHRAPLGAQLWAILRNIHRIRAFAYLSLRDPQPAITDLARLLQKHAGSFRSLPNPDSRAARIPRPAATREPPRARGIARRR